MTDIQAPAPIVILNGAPRSGKTSIARALQAQADEIWINLGVDVYARATPEKLLPGIGLRPGGERADLEKHLPRLYAGLWESIAAHARCGLSVVADVGLHDGHSRALNLLQDAARRLDGLPVLFVGVYCTLPEILARRAADPNANGTRYARPMPNQPVPRPVLLWQKAVHQPGQYDLALDTATLSPEDCATQILDRLCAPRERPSVFEQINGTWRAG